MKKYFVLYNSKAGNGTGKEQAEKILPIIQDGEAELIDMLGIDDYDTFFQRLGEEDSLVIAGGDGTVNYLVNHSGIDQLVQPVYFYACGTGNDLLNDLGTPKGELVQINQCLKELPVVTVNGKSSKFINGVGYGIDGYCCEEGDKLRQIPGKKVNYAAIAIKGMFFFFKTTNATVTVDGEKHTYKKVWLAPTMNGRYYGGGMNMAPMQDRLNADRTVTLVVMHGTGRLKTLIRFSSIFEGAHVKYKDMCDFYQGHEITVEFDRPTALQIDGETISGVTSYSVKTAKK